MSKRGENPTDTGNSQTIMKLLEMMVAAGTMGWRLWMAYKQAQQMKALEANQHLIARGIGEAQATREGVENLKATIANGTSGTSSQ